MLFLCVRSFPVYLHVVYFGSRTVGVTLSSSNNNKNSPVCPKGHEPWKSPFGSHKPHSPSADCLGSCDDILHSVAANKPSKSLFNHSITIKWQRNCTQGPHQLIQQLVLAWRKSLISVSNQDRAKPWMSEDDNYTSFVSKYVKWASNETLGTIFKI